MKIICEKDNPIKSMLELVRHLLESESSDYPILKDDLILEISLKNKEGISCPENKDTIHLTQKDLEHTKDSVSILDYYYNHDVMTKLYNRGKYERDLKKLQADGADGITCIYIDAVGLHEINNHLGHAAGDHMLCSIADGIRQSFPESLSYRIGGDEFVILETHLKKEAVKAAVSSLKAFLKQEEFEISVGIKTNKNAVSLIETVNQAEYAMRYDKAQFYRKNGDRRQMRSLNYRLEKILLENQDASQFLNAIALEYKGVYMVDPDKDTCRHIYIPEYFQHLLQKYNGIFSKAIRAYCDEFVCENDQELFHTVFDFDLILKQLRDKKPFGFTYEKKDGSKVLLQITIYDAASCDSNQMLWIFMDKDRN